MKIFAYTVSIFQRTVKEIVAMKIVPVTELRRKAEENKVMDLLFLTNTISYSILSYATDFIIQVLKF